MSNIVCCGILLLSSLVPWISCQSINDTKALLHELFVARDYRTDIRPVNNQSEYITIGVELAITDLNSLDIINGDLSVAGHLSMLWRDDQLQWNPVYFGGIAIMSLDRKQVWRPTFSQYAQTGSQESSVSASVWLDSDGHVLWIISGTLYTRCKIDVFYYPVDKHTCDFTFMSVRYTKQEMLVELQSEKINTDNFNPNGEWELGASTCEVIEHTEGFIISGFSCKITIKRRPAFCMIHMGLPLIFLTVLTIMVFWVPPACVERISLSVTLFLAFSVLVSGLVEEIPRNSVKLPLYSILLIFLNAFSSTSVGLSIFVVRLSIKTESNVPNWIRKFMVAFKTTTCAHAQVEQMPPTDTEKKLDDKNAVPVKARDIGSQKELQITWLEVAYFIDRIAFTIVVVILTMLGLVILCIVFA